MHKGKVSAPIIAWYVYEERSECYENTHFGVEKLPIKCDKVGLKKVFT